MIPEIIDTGPRLLAGFSFYGDPFETHGFWEEENEIGRIWQRWMAFYKKEEDLLSRLMDGKAFYELFVHHEKTQSRGHFEVFVGMPVTSVEKLPVELVIKSLPALRYAIFTFHGEAIRSDCYTDIRKWLAEAGLTQCCPFNMQVYDERFKGMDRIHESEMDVFIPVKRLSGTGTDHPRA